MKIQEIGMAEFSRRAVLAGTGSSMVITPAFGAIQQAGERDMPLRRMAVINGIHLNFYDSGAGPVIVLLHGFPEFSYSWRHQIRAFVAAGYRVIVPDQRGCGLSDCPSHVEDYDLRHLLGDIVGLLDHLGIDKAVIAGHDWGGILAWQMPLFFKDRVAGVIGVSTPFIPHWQLWLQPDTLRHLGPKARGFVPDAHVDPIVQMREVYEPDQYVLVFCNGTKEADDLMNRDPRRTVNTFLRRNVLSADAYAKLPQADHEEAILKPLTGAAHPLPGQAILNAQELDFVTASFTRTTFTPGINWYRNISRNWQAGRDVAQRINVPSLMISAVDDLVLSPAMTAGMSQYIPDLEKHVITGSAHWIQQEQPEKFNEVALDWLHRRFPA